ncbi:hypothetical protein [Adhaeribacter pallidiroseus]|uniref:hypothetical protein n=1 Tax=Adhaeribacter pallidiroseus TaxID=2072847 RepID=UPI0011C07DD8|nr:hypothetical protein [Adhaeribacter pallidiroseus]
MTLPKNFVGIVVDIMYQPQRSKPLYSYQEMIDLLTEATETEFLWQVHEILIYEAEYYDQMERISLQALFRLKRLELNNLK